jgi:CRP/FNR family transcriptional regulator, cyclic AMP receptor protein
LFVNPVIGIGRAVALSAVLGEDLLANFGKEDKPEPMIAKISQETLAEMIGTTRSRVSFFMNKFRKLGFIHYNGGIQVHSSLLNLVLHEEPHIET